MTLTIYETKISEGKKGKITMRNAREGEIKKCIFKDYNDFKDIIDEITDGLLICDYNLDGLYITESHKAEENDDYWDGEILDALSKYFDVKVTSFHADDSEHLGVWICIE